MTADSAFAALATFDPDLARDLGSAWQQNEPALSEVILTDMVDTIFIAYRQEIHLGAAVADGYRALVKGATPHALGVFGREIRQVSSHSAALAQHLAGILPSVLRTRDTGLLKSFRKTLAILLEKGDYLVKAPLEGLKPLIATDVEAGKAYLTLLQASFNRPMSYHRCQYLGNLLPRAVGGFPVCQRSIRIRQMTRLIGSDLDLIEPYLEGLAQGLDLLSAEALPRFVDLVLKEVNRDRAAGRRFLSLRSGRGREACRSLQTAATLAGTVARLNRYIAARTGSSRRIRPISTIVTTPSAGDRLASATDGSHLFLPAAIDRFATRKDNARLLETMAKFEAGLLEFDTFTFDIERGRDMGCLDGLGLAIDDESNASVSDFTVFSRSFHRPRLALDLFTLYEHARIRMRLTSAYPGLVHCGLPLYQTAMRGRIDKGVAFNLLDACYAILALDLPPEETLRNHPQWRTFVRDITAAFAACGPETMRVEDCAGLVFRTYDRFDEILSQPGPEPPPLAPPFRMSLQPELIEAAGRQAQHQAARLKAHFKDRGLNLYQGDLRHLLQRSDGRPKNGDILRLAGLAAADGRDGGPNAAASMGCHGDFLSKAPMAEVIEDPGDVERITWLKEWNTDLGDYLHDHVRVRDRRLAGHDIAFYTSVLERSEGLVHRIRRSFELLRPEGLGLLRQWVEGDDFDYRALLDFVLDRKAGLLPSERLYIKRVKQRRDVAVMLLVDLSRSTTNIGERSDRSVLDVAKEALVLLTQALEVVGDAYAMTGFSGTGRLGVDYFRIKDFDEPLSERVKATLSALAPQRNTRMGAAIRRAALELAARPNRVRLLLMIGDGFPNDADYKGHYAVQDTRQAIAEARSRGIVTQAITVNLPASPQLDELYGPVRHTVISQVDELPDKLWRLYGALTLA